VVNARLSPKERLGATMFFDKNLSSPKGQSCASCHNSGFAFTDPDQTTPTSEGAVAGRFAARNSPSALYAAFSPFFHYDSDGGTYVGGQFLDGHAATLEQQIHFPLLNPLEMNNASSASVIDKIRSADYASLFRQVYGPAALDDSDAAFAQIAEAIAAFEQHPAPGQFSSKYDAYLAGKTRLAPAELRGLRAFEDANKGNCAACHLSRPAADGTPPLFTDFTYDNLGVPRNPHNRFYSQSAAFNPDGKTFIDRGLGAFVGLASEDGKFKVPTLRNIARTAPYMHNGYFSNLKALVDFYNTRDVKPACKNPLADEAEAGKRGCWPAAEIADSVNHDELGNLKLSAREVDDIVAFMNTLNDGWNERATSLPAGFALRP
jgi:cytochrome c peroxidase